MIVDVDPKLIKPNPWQPRTRMDPAQLQELADSIKANGLLQPPIAREGERGRFELAFGHRRFEAWKLAKPGEPFPVELRDLTDQQMAEHAATENGQREDLNPVERARGLRLLCSPPFNMTQAAAGKLYGLATQGAASNAMRLLELPDKILDLVVEGKLIEKHARELVFVARNDPQKAIEIAQEVIDDDGDDGPERVLADELSEWFQKVGKRMAKDVWPLDWAPVGETATVKPKGEPAYDPPACQGCQFFRKGKWEHYCARPACFNAKLTAWSRKEAERVGKKLGIAVVRQGEKVAQIWRGEWENREWAAALLRDKPAHLRILANGSSTNDYQLKEALGSKYASLGTTDLALAEKRKKDLAAKRQQQHNQYKPKSKEEQEAEEREIKRRRTVAKAWVDRASEHLAAVLPTNRALLVMLAEIIGDYQTRDIVNEVKKTSKVNDQRELVMGLMLRGTEGIGNYWNPELTKIRNNLADVAKGLKVKLPAGWDAVPDALQPKAAANGKAPKKAAKKKAKAKK